MKLLRVKKFPLYDVFLDPSPDQPNGWLNWSRVLLKDSKVIHITGNPLTHANLTSIRNSLVPSAGPSGANAPVVTTPDNIHS